MKFAIWLFIGSTCFLSLHANAATQVNSDNIILACLKYALPDPNPGWQDISFKATGTVKQIGSIFKIRGEMWGEPGACIYTPGKNPVATFKLDNYELARLHLQKNSGMAPTNYNRNAGFNTKASIDEVFIQIDSKVKSYIHQSINKDFDYLIADKYRRPALNYCGCVLRADGTTNTLTLTVEYNAKRYSSVGERTSNSNSINVRSLMPYADLVYSIWHDSRFLASKNNDFVTQNLIQNLVLVVVFRDSYTGQAFIGEATKDSNNFLLSYFAGEMYYFSAVYKDGVLAGNFYNGNLLSFKTSRDIQGNQTGAVAARSFITGR